MVETTEPYADDDPEYEGDAVADIGADAAAEVAELEEADPAQTPPDEGDAGQPGPSKEG
jgi:hypothetical protein